MLNYAAIAIQHLWIPFTNKLTNTIFYVNHPTGVQKVSTLLTEYK